MDIRVSAYSPVTVTAAQTGNTRLTAVQDARNSSPVQQITPSQLIQTQGAGQAAQRLAEGETRGTRVDIFA